MPRNTERTAWGLGTLMPVLATATWIEKAGRTKAQPLYTQADVQRVRIARGRGHAVSIAYRWRRDAGADTDTSLA